MTHHLKCHPDPFRKISIGKKTAEFRRNDRNFQEGDTLILHEYNPGKEEFSGRFLGVTVEDITHGGKYGIPDGYCNMPIVLLRRAKP